MQKQKKKSSGAGSIGYIVLALFFILGGEIFAIFLPIIIIGVITYFVVKAVKKKGKVPVVTKQNPPKRTQPPQQQPAATRPAMEQPVRKPQQPMTTGIDYGQRHRENAKRMLDAGLITQEEYRMQLQRSQTL